MRGTIIVWSMAVLAALAGCQGKSAPNPKPTPQKTEQKAEAPVAKTNEVAKPMNPLVLITTSEGPIKVELWPDKAPATVANFLAYTKEGFFDGTIFHRVIPTFMIQGGGFTPDMQQKPTHAPVKNEARSDVPNKRGTLAMARTNVVDSATGQFFINVVDNAFLDHRDDTPRGFGYCVFGQVVEGMDVVDRIRQTPTKEVGPFSDVPVKPMVIQSVKVVEQK